MCIELYVLLKYTEYIEYIENSDGQKEGTFVVHLDVLFFSFPSSYINLWMESRPGRHHGVQPPTLMLPAIPFCYHCALPSWYKIKSSYPHQTKQGLWFIWSFPTFGRCSHQVNSNILKWVSNIIRMTSNIINIIESSHPL